MGEEDEAARKGGGAIDRGYRVLSGGGEDVFALQRRLLLWRKVADDAKALAHARRVPLLLDAPRELLAGGLEELLHVQVVGRNTQLEEILVRKLR